MADNGTATLAKATPRADLSEIGRSGLSTIGGTLFDEALRDLQGGRAVKMWTEMRSDDVAGAVLFAIDMLGRQVSWRVDPASQAPEDLERADFLHGCLFDDMSVTWRDTLSDALTMLPYGFSFMEVCWKIRGGEVDDPRRRSRFTDGRIGIRKLVGRAQDSIVRWNFDAEGGVQGAVQAVAPGYAPVEIPIEKAILFRTTANRGNPEGRSIFRTAYLSYVFKKRIREIEAIGIERDLAGYPSFELQEGAPDLWLPENAALLAKLERIIRNIRRDTQEGLVLPPWLKFVLVSTGSRRQFDTGGIIARYDSRIAMTSLADFILIGHESVGSFALTKTKADLFAVAMGGYLDIIADTINRHLVPRLMRLNGWPAEPAPRLVHGDIESPNLEALGAFVTALAGAGMPLFPSGDGALERALLDAAKLPVGDEAAVAKRGARGDAETLAAAMRRLTKEKGVRA